MQTETTFFPGNTAKAGTYRFIGEVVAVHIKDEFFTPKGIVDIMKIKPPARIDYIIIDPKLEGI